MILFARIQPKLKDGITVPRGFGDYTVTVDDSKVPGVELLRKIG